MGVGRTLEKTSVSNVSVSFGRPEDKTHINVVQFLLDPDNTIAWILMKIKGQI